MRKICIIICMLLVLTGCASERTENESDTKKQENMNQELAEKEDKKMEEKVYNSIDDFVNAIHCDPIVGEKMNQYARDYIEGEIVSVRENNEYDWEGDIVIIVTTKEGKEYDILSSSVGDVYGITDRESDTIVYAYEE